MHDFLFKKQSILLSIFQKNEIQDFEEESPEKKNLDMSKLDEKSLLDKNETKQVSGYCKGILEICKKIIPQDSLLPPKTIGFIRRSKVFPESDPETVNNNFSKKNDKTQETKDSLLTNFVSSYLAQKNSKISDFENNIYLQILSRENLENKSLATTLCSFIHSQLMSEWQLDDRNKKYILLENLNNLLFMSTRTIQSCLRTIITPENMGGIDRLWFQMKITLNYVNYKTTVDRFWKEEYRRVMLLMRFHQLLCEENFVEFKLLLSKEILPNDTIDRVQRWTTIFQKMSDNFQWHFSTIEDIADFQYFHRSYLFPIAAAVFENLAELCTGPCSENQNKIYRYILDRYRG